MKDKKKSNWVDVLDFPLLGRIDKPRHQGQTMVIDTGLGLTETKELLEMAAEYIDFIKLGFGTSALYSAGLLRDKINLVRSYGVDIFPGGTFLEVAILQGKMQPYLELTSRLGYSFVEVSDGTIEIPAPVRRQAIQEALEFGLQVIAEVGKKDSRDQISQARILDQIQQDLQWGAYKVIVEGRESGQGVVIYDSSGAVKHNELEEMAAGIADLNRIIWEAPHKHQQQELIMRFGANVNLGNIQARDVLALEALRVGLRGDTLRTTLQRESNCNPA